MSALDALTSKQAPPPTPPRWASSLVFAIVIAAFVTGFLGTALSPTLIKRHPLWMIGLNANNRYLILATNQVGAVGFFAVALARRVIPTLAFYLVGYWYGERAVRWLEGREPSGGEAIRLIEKLFDRFGWWVIAVAPMSATCLFAGADQFKPRPLIALIVASITARLVLIRWLGEQFSATLTNVVGWIDDARGPLLIVTVGLVVFMMWRQGKTRVESFEELTALDDDDDDDDPELAS